MHSTSSSHFEQRRRGLLTAAALLGAALSTACGGGSDDPSPLLNVDGSGNSNIDPASLSATLATYPLAPLSPAEAASLSFMREEEQLAYAVYLKSAALYQTPVFANIAASELTHAAAVKTLLDRYQLPDPLAGLPVGSFKSASFQALYDSLVAASRISLVQALKVGLEIEELDIRDIAQQKTVVDNTDILMVYDNLAKGSRNHLRSFWKVLLQQGASYVPKYISQAEFDAIVNSPIEAGR